MFYVNCGIDWFFGLIYILNMGSVVNYLLFMGVIRLLCD